MTLTTALRVLSWTAVIGILGMAVCARTAERPNWCPLDMDPQFCVTEAVTL